MKKLVLIFCVLLFSIVFTQSALAQSKDSLKTAYPLNVNPDVKLDFHTYTQNIFIETLSTATCFIGGVDMLNPEAKCLGIDPTTKKIGYVDQGGGLASIAGGLIGATFNIPVSSTNYAHDLAKNFGLTKNAYAIPIDGSEGGGSQSLGTGFGTGIGFVGLSPVLSIWKSFRNVTYLLFVFLFIIIGLGIMFRLNIDARTVMTIQNQIPKIIIGLVLITFSYAIAGFLIDMMYVAIYLIIHIFDSQGLATLTNIDTNPINAVGRFGGVNDIAGPAAKGISGIVSSLFDGTIGNFLGAIVGGIIGSFIGGGGITGAIGGIIGGLVGFLAGSKLLGLVAMVIAYLIITIAMFSALFRVWFMLIKAYIFILLDVIFAPFWIIGAILPGAPGGVGPWLRSLLANLAAFPTVILLFMIGKTIQDQISSSGGNFIPPMVGNLGSNSVEAVGSIIGLGIILIMPEAVNMTKQAFKAPEQKLTSAIGRAIGTGQGVIGKPIGAMKHELFGKDAFGNPKEGSLWAQRKFGTIGRVLTGGGLKDKTGSESGEKTSMFKRPSLGWRGSKINGSGKYERNVFGRLTNEGKANRQERESQAKKIADAQKETNTHKGSFDLQQNPHNYEAYRIPGSNQEFIRKKEPPQPGEQQPGQQAPNFQAQGDEIADGDGHQPQEGVPENPPQNVTSEELEKIIRAARQGAQEGARGSRETILEKAVDIARGRGINENDLTNPEIMQPFITEAHAAAKRIADNGPTSTS